MIRNLVIHINFLFIFFFTISFNENFHLLSDYHW